jgi:hypothetical protein
VHIEWEYWGFYPGICKLVHTNSSNSRWLFNNNFIRIIIYSFRCWKIVFEKQMWFTVYWLKIPSFNTLCCWLLLHQKPILNSSCEIQNQLGRRIATAFMDRHNEFQIMINLTNIQTRPNNFSSGHKYHSRNPTFGISCFY